MRYVCALLIVAATAGCGAAVHSATVHISPETPPSPATWPAYPSFRQTSCWTRPFGEGRPLQAAPSRAVAQPTHLTPATIGAKVLARLGDRRFVHTVAFGPPPPITLQHLRGYFAGVHPPANALWAWVSAPVANDALLGEHPEPRRLEAQGIAQWEAGLVIGALRDEFCAAGGAPLVGWSVGKGVLGMSDRTQALEQDFPNPSPASYRTRVQQIGRRFGFTVQELRLLRPRQLAPLLIVRTDRDRREFVHDVAAMMRLLDPVSSGPGRAAVTFEGFFFEAVDAKGPFVRVDNHYRGQVEGGEWSWSRCDYPYPHSEPFGAKPCP